MNPQYFLLFYDVVDDYVTKRVPFRKEHLTLALDYTQKGHLVLGGAMDQPADRALLVFYVTDALVIEEFVRKDPYVRAGLVKSWNIRTYRAVAGTACKNPVKISDL